MGSWYEFGATEGNSANLADMDRYLNEGSESMRDAINEARNLKWFGANQKDFDATTAPLHDQIGRLDSIQGLLKGLPGELQRGALASTSGAGIAAASAARMSGSGRYGSGGNAALMAARGASNAAGTQSAALSQALVQGRMADAQFQSGVLGQRGQVAGALTQVLQSQAGLKEERARIPINMQVELSNLLLGQAGIKAGIATSRMAAQAQENSAFIGGLMSGVGQIGAAYSGG